ncbi:LysR family transcriptional regulator [Bordetella sp. BOR01]|uniref:LysR family transcriptional regulator n=1 Tax=Bordetella sp. BOR01 TaxID=2854779 RepID=UPI001C471174|nr:LysR family transcriptional regulator [Bordetella sp. BOR01]MBV7486353.1 LysR family transcriptional regulator [Bordetella sp. BOR01]
MTNLAEVVDTNLLKTFFMVADSGGLSAAASMLGLPQSVVSRRIKELESICGARLLYRHGRGVVATPAGQTLLETARPIVAELALAINSIADCSARPSGQVSLALSPMLMSAIGANFLAEMRQCFPDVRVNLVAAYSRYQYEWLMQGRIDIAILNEVGLTSQLVFEPLGATRVVFACRAESEFLQDSTEQAIRFEDVRSIPLVIPTREHGLRRHIDLAATKNNIALNIVYEVDDIQLTKELVAMGKVATLLPRLGLTKEIVTGAFSERRLEAPEIAARFVVATAPSRPITHTMSATIGVLKSQVAGLLI